MEPHPPTSRFRPIAFDQSGNKTRLIFKLHDPSAAHHEGAQHKPPDARLSDLFFRRGRLTNSNRTRLMRGAHFVRFDHQLKSIRIPSMEFDTVLQQFTLDWRELVQDFLRDELKCRPRPKPLGT